MTPIHDEEEQRAKNKLRTYLAGLTHPPGLKLTHPPVRTTPYQFATKKRYAIGSGDGRMRSPFILLPWHIMSP